MHKMARPLVARFPAQRLFAARAMHTYAIVDVDKSVAVRRFAHDLVKHDDQHIEWRTKHVKVLRANAKVEQAIKSGTSIEEAEGDARAAHAAASASGTFALSLVTAQRNLFKILSQQPAKRAEAVELGMRALDTTRSVVGPRHPTTVAILRDLGATIVESGDMQAAEPLLREAASACADVYGDVHEETLAANTALGQSLIARRNLRDAVPVLRANLSAARRLHGDAASATLLRSSNLAALLFEAGEYHQAEAVLTWHLRAIERVHGRASAQARAAAMRLAECRAAGGDEACAADLAFNRVAAQVGAHA